MKPENRTGPDGFWGELSQMEVSATLTLADKLKTFAPIIRDCYECALWVPMLPRIAKKLSPDLWGASLLLKRCMTDLRAIWVLILCGYTSQAASVTASLFETALLASCMCGDHTFAKKCIASSSVELPGPQALCQEFARKTCSPAEFEEIWVSLYGHYKWLCKIKHPTFASAMYDALSATVPGKDGYVVMAVPDLRDEDIPVKAMILTIGISRTKSLVDRFVEALGEHSDSPEWERFRERQSGINTQFDTVFEQYLSQPLPNPVLDDPFRKTYARMQRNKDKKSI